MLGSPAYELEKDWVVLFLQALCSGVTKVRVACELHADMDIACSFEGVCQIWCPRRSKAMYDSETQYEANGRPIAPESWAECPYSTHVLEGWSPEGMIVSCYSCYETFRWSMKRRQYVPVNVPGPLPAPSREALDGYLGSSGRYCPDYLSANMLSRLVRSRKLREKR